MTGIGKYLPLTCVYNGEKTQELFKADWAIVEFLPRYFEPGTCDVSFYNHNEPLDSFTTFADLVMNTKEPLRPQLVTKIKVFVCNFGFFNFFFVKL